MKSTHTPGPWKVINPPSRDNPCLHIFAEYTEEEKEQFPYSQGKWIASVRNYSKNSQESNARVIAAAPSILEAASEVIKLMREEREQQIFHHGWHSEKIDDAEKVLMSAFALIEGIEIKV